MQVRVKPLVLKSGSNPWCSYSLCVPFSCLLLIRMIMPGYHHSHSQFLVVTVVLTYIPLCTDPVVITGDYYPLTEANDPGQTYPQNATCGDKANSAISVHW